MTDKSQSTFRLSYEVRTTIATSPAVVWAKLTDAKGFPAWNSTVESIEGAIVLGNKLAIRVPIAKGRVFKPKVVVFDAPHTMVWRDGFAPMFQGTRTFTCVASGGGHTEFTMKEVFVGAMLPMIKGSLPDFAPVFDRYAADLKAACEVGLGT